LTSINWKAVIFWGVIVGGIILIVLYREAITTVLTGIGSQTEGLEIGVEQ
jgi:hypothetical protein